MKCKTSEADEKKRTVKDTFLDDKHTSQLNPNNQSLIFCAETSSLKWHLNFMCRSSALQLLESSDSEGLISRAISKPHLWSNIPFELRCLRSSFKVTSSFEPKLWKLPKPNLKYQTHPWPVNTLQPERAMTIKLLIPWFTVYVKPGAEVWFKGFHGNNAAPIVPADLQSILQQLDMKGFEVSLKVVTQQGERKQVWMYRSFIVQKTKKLA